MKNRFITHCLFFISTPYSVIFKKKSNTYPRVQGVSLGGFASTNILNCSYLTGFPLIVIFYDYNLYKIFLTCTLIVKIKVFLGLEYIKKKKY